MLRLKMDNPGGWLRAAAGSALLAVLAAGGLWTGPGAVYAQDSPGEGSAEGSETGEDSGAAIDMESIAAKEEFLWGVNAFHQGYYNKAILSLEKSLAGQPEDPRTRLWLGRAYYQAGYEDAALSEWKGLIRRGLSPGFLQSFVEVVEARRGLERELKEPQRYVSMNEVEGRHEEYILFSHPSSVRSLPTGSFLLVGHSSNEVLEIDVNGAVKNRYWGGVRRFNRPFDVQPRPEGGFYVSEYGGDRIARCDENGNRQESYGETGSGPGEFRGPQFMAMDSKGALYVTDWGNRRVVKLSADGEPLLTFGTRRSDFSGLRGPTGIAVWDDRVYVADKRRGTLEVFDLSGNWVRSLGEETLDSPEGLSVVNRDRLLVADGGVVRAYSREEGAFSVLASPPTGGDKLERRLTKGVVGANGNLVTVDYNNHRMEMLTELGDMYSGLFIRIDRINSDNFPTVTADLTVETRLGKPVVGLDQHNFYLTENRRPVEEFEIVYRGYQPGAANLSVVAGPPPEDGEAQKAMDDALSRLQGAAEPGDSLRLVTLNGREPVVAAEPEDDIRREFQRWADEEAASGGSSYGKEGVPLDAGVRLAVSELVQLRGKKAVVYLAGEAPEGSGSSSGGFSRYGLVETMQYLQNNGITFYTVYLNRDDRREELEFLSRETGGHGYYLYRPEGIRDVPDQVRQKASGTYSLRYESISPTDFGRAYIPMEAETFLIRRSGRDEAGYFAPLEY